MMREKSGPHSWGVAVEATSKIGTTGENIAAIGITNQRETAIVWNRKTGDPVCNAIQTNNVVQPMKADGGASANDYLIGTGR